MNMPLISVIMPVYNAEKYVAEAIESILAQTYSNFEFLIFNDGSNDNSLNIIKSYQQKDSRIKLLNYEENKGYIFHLNTGLEIAQGEYIARMDADDISLPERLEKQVNYLDTNPKVGLCSTNYRLINEEGVVIMEKGFVSTSLPLEWLVLWENPIAHPTVMLRKQLINQYQLRYNADCHPAEDYDLWCHIVLLTDIYRLEDILLTYRVLNNSSFRSNMHKALNQSIQSSEYLAGQLTHKTPPIEHKYLTIFATALGWSLPKYDFIRIWQWTHLLKKEAKKYWQWDEDTYKYVHVDVNRRVQNYFETLSKENKVKIFFLSLLFFQLSISLYIFKYFFRKIGKVYKLFKF